jgi:hypothetical protein
VDSEHFLTLDERFISLVWGIKYKAPGSQRELVIEQFWKKADGDYQGDEEGLRLRSFVLNGFIHALDELHELEAPPRRADTSSWGDLWNPRRCRSSAVTDGPSSQGGPRVGLGLTDPCVTGGHPSQT